MRLFIAFDVSKEVEEHLADVQKKLDANYAKLAFTNYFHLTLKFLGDVPEDKIPKITETLETVKAEKFSLTLDSLGFFNDENYITVVWVGIKKNEIVNTFQEEVESALLHYFPRGKFHPHITLARVKYVLEKEKFVSLVKSVNVNQINFLVDKFVLYKSTLTRDGPAYEIVKEFDLE